MNGAESLVRTLIGNGVDTCFANPGTSEMHFVAALDRVPGIRCVLTLFEGVATGAADGYARIARKPASTLLHCGPGLANGLANLHNAQRARVPIVNIVGDQATFHRPYDAPLTADTEGWAKPVSKWCRTSMSAAEIGQDAADAICAARSGDGGIATLILPSDTSWDEGGRVAAADGYALPAPVSDDSLRAAAEALEAGAETMILIGGSLLREEPLKLAHRIAGKTGARLLASTANAATERGQGRFPVARLPYPAGIARSVLKDVKTVILLGTPEPVAFFAYPGQPSRLLPDGARVLELAGQDQDGADALARLADLIGAPELEGPASAPRPEVPTGEITSESVGRTIAALMPENCIVVDESISFGKDLLPATQNAPRHDWLQLTGGAIGDGLPMATGAAVAGPGRRVINIQADGSALYTVQALWTQAREKLDVTTIILSNRKYAILLAEYAGVGATPGRTAMDMMDLGNPGMNWVSIAEGFGVEAARASTLEQLADLVRAANDKSGPFLIELEI